MQTNTPLGLRRGPETMLLRVVRILGEVVTPIVVVVAAVNQDRPELLDGVIVTRDENDARGPLEGLRADLKALPLVEDLSAGAGRGGSSAFAKAAHRASRQSSADQSVRYADRPGGPP